LFGGNLGNANLPQLFARSTSGTLTPATIAGGDGTSYSGVQSITLGGTGNEVRAVSATGAFSITVNAQTTPGLTNASTAAQVQAALEALSTVGVGNVAVTGAPGSYTITFQNALGNTALGASFSVSGSATNPSTTAGVPLGGDFTLTYQSSTTNDIAVGASASTVQTPLTTDIPALTGNVQGIAATTSAGRTYLVLLPNAPRNTAV